MLRAAASLVPSTPGQPTSPLEQVNAELRLQSGQQKSARTSGWRLAAHRIGSPPRVLASVDAHHADGRPEPDVRCAAAAPCPAAHAQPTPFAAIWPQKVLAAGTCVAAAAIPAAHTLSLRMLPAACTPLSCIRMCIPPRCRSVALRRFLWCATAFQGSLGWAAWSHLLVCSRTTSQPNTHTRGVAWTRFIALWCVLQR